MFKYTMSLAALFLISTKANALQLAELECLATSAVATYFKADYQSPKILLNAEISNEEEGVVSTKNHVAADENWVPRNPVYTKFYRFNMRPDNSHGEFYYILLPKNPTTHVFSGYLQSGDEHGGMLPTIKLKCNFN